MSRPTLRFLFQHPAHFIALGFGAGLAPWAPGTFGTAVAIPIALLLRDHASDAVFAIVVVALFALGSWASQVTGRALGVPDHGSIVIDEVVAFMAILFFTGMTFILAWIVLQSDAQHIWTGDAAYERPVEALSDTIVERLTALGPDRLGINGICKCKLHAWKIFPDQAEFSGEDFGYFVDPVMYRRALADCLEQDIDVINLSIGGPGEPDQQEQDLFDALLANGTTIVAAMGNEREEGSPISFPAAIPGVIAVGATSITDRITQFSNRGDHISLCAPGKGIWSTLPTYPGQFGFEAVRGPTGKWVEGKPLRRETDYDDWDGTSMASPHVAAAVALLVAKNGKTGPGATRTTLIGKLDAVPAMGGKKFDSDYGHGRLNLARFYR